MLSQYFTKHLVFVNLLLVNVYGSGQEYQTNASDILCTKVTSWKDAMADCLHKRGRPLTHKEITTTKFLEKINMTFWTADYATVSYDSGSANIDYDLLLNMRCGYATVLLEKTDSSNATLIDVLTVNYRNCTETLGYICPGEGTYLEVYLTRKTWMDAKDSCGISQQRSSEKNRINPRKGVAHIHPAPPSHKKLDVWVSLIAITDIHTVQSNVPTEDIVKYGSWSNSGGFRMIEESQCHEFMALCRLDSSYFVNESLLTDCRKLEREIGIAKDSPTPNEGTTWLHITIVVSSAVFLVNISGCVLLWIYQNRKFRPLGTIQERTADVSTCTTSATGTQTVFNSGPDQDLGHEDEEIEDSHKDEELQDNHEDQELQHATNDAVSGTRCIIIKMH